MTALSGLKVLDLSRFIAGPHCAMMLADFGADVVKIERINGGDDTRAIPPFEGKTSVYFSIFNRNKRSVALNLRHGRGQELLRQLVAEADVLIENFRPGTMEAMGCGWEELHQINPRLVMARISGYGRKDVRANAPCFDVVAQAASGLMELTGEPDGKPMVSGTYVTDYTTAIYSAFGIMTALHARHKSGVGQLVDTSLIGSGLSLLMTSIADFGLNGTPFSRHGNRDRYTSPSGTYSCADGRWVQLIGGNSDHFPRLTSMLKRPDLLTDPMSATAEARRQNADALDTIIAEWCAARDSDTVIAAAEAAALPARKVANGADLLSNQSLWASNYLVNVAGRDGARDMPMQGFPVQLGEGTLGSIRPAPRLGEHTYEVLEGWLALSPEAIDIEREAGVVN